MYMGKNYQISGGSPPNEMGEKLNIKPKWSTANSSQEGHVGVSQTVQAFSVQ